MFTSIPNASGPLGKAPTVPSKSAIVLSSPAGVTLKNCSHPVIAMIDYATYCQIRSPRQEQNLRVGQIAQRLQMDKKTVRYWLNHSQPFPSLPPCPTRCTYHKS